MPKKISNKKPSSTITIETKHESSIYNTPPPSSKNKKKEEKEELINAGTLGRPIGRPSPFQQKYIQKALAKAKKELSICDYPRGQYRSISRRARPQVYFTKWFYCESSFPALHR